MINYIKGDATSPIIIDGKRIITHIVNDIGAFGKGFSGAIRNKWPEVEKFYKKEAKYSKNFKLGEVQWIFIDIDLAICNMIAQKGLRSASNPIPLQYDALEKCLKKLGKGARAISGQEKTYIVKDKISIHAPKFGAGLAGGDWKKIENLIDEHLWDIDVYIYIF